MAQVLLTVNGRDYAIACEDGEEERLRELGGKLDQRVGELVRRVGQIGEARLLLMASLLLVDELAEASAQPGEHPASGHAPAPAATSAAAAAELVDTAAARIEKIAAALESD